MTGTSGISFHWHGLTLIPACINNHCKRGLRFFLIFPQFLAYHRRHSYVIFAMNHRYYHLNIETGYFFIRPTCIIKLYLLMSGWCPLLPMQQHLYCRVFGLQTPIKETEFKGSESNDGQLVGIVLHPTNKFAVTSCTDKNMTLLDFETNECLVTFRGHSLQATGMKFLSDGKHLITVSGDG